MPIGGGEVPDRPDTTPPADPAAVSPPLPGPSARGDILGQLAALQASAAAAGDVEAVRTLHGAIGRLLGDPEAAGPVVDIAAERARRGGR